MAQQQPPPLILFLAGAAAGALIAANGVLSAVRKRAGRSRSRDDGRRVRVGLEVAKDDNWKIFRGKKVGVVSNPTGVLPTTLEHAVDVMHASVGTVDIRAVFGPEQGFRGVGQNSNPYGSYDSDKENGSDGSFVDQRTGLPVYDTYLKKGPELTAILERSGVDVVAFDIQDVGARYYAYVWTLYDVMVAAASPKPISVVVLDRPNPLGGEVLEGPVDIAVGCESLVGRKPIPVRHGMTVGELAWFLNKKYVAADPDNGSRKSVKLSVVAMRGYRRRMTWEETGLPWVPPSPNMPTPRTALAYVGGALLEGTNCCEGKGTTAPFELVGATWADGRLADFLMRRTPAPAARSVAPPDASNESPQPRSEEEETEPAPSRRGRSSVKRGLNYRPTTRSLPRGTARARTAPGPRPAPRAAASARSPAAGRAPREREEEEQEQTEPTAERENDSNSRRSPVDGPAATYREAYFTPTSGALQGRIVSGVQVYPRGIRERPVQGGESKFCWP